MQFLPIHCRIIGSLFFRLQFHYHFQSFNILQRNILIFRFANDFQPTNTNIFLLFFRFQLSDLHLQFFFFLIVHRFILRYLSLTGINLFLQLHFFLFAFQ